MGLALGGCVDDGEDSTTQMTTMTTMSDGVESDSTGEATYGVPMTETGDTDPFGPSSTTTGGPETDTDTGGGPSTGEPDTDTDTDAGASSSSGGAGSSSSTSG